MSVVIVYTCNYVLCHEC